MKNIKLIISMLVLLSITACSDSREKVEEIKLKPYSVKLEKGEDMNNSIWGDKPSYKLKIKGSHSKVEVFINGVRIYKHFALSSCYIEYPINDYIATGENEIKVQIPTGKNVNYKIDEQAKVTVSLVVHSSETGKEYTVSTIDYDNSAKDKLALSSEPKEYKIFDISPLDPEFVKVSQVVLKPYKFRAGKPTNGVTIVQQVLLRTPYPRWKFLDSELITSEDMDKISDEEYEKLRATKKIQELYAIYGKIHSAIKENRVASIIDMFDERGVEMEAAFYDKEGYQKEGLPKQFLDPENGKLKPYNPDKLYYFIEDNRKLIYIDAIKFVDKNGFVTTFGMKFRRENGKWILTR
jgi:hypothetical protein